MKGVVTVLSRLWPWRVWFAAALVGLVAIALAAAFVRERSLEPLILRAMDRAPRVAAGLSLAHERLTIAALEAQTAGAPPEPFARDLEAFRGEIARLDAADRRALFADLPRFAATLDRLRAFRAESEALAAVMRSADGPPPAEALAALVADLARLREPLADLVDSAIALQRLEIVRRTREVRAADRIAVAALALAGLVGGVLVLLLLAARKPASPTPPPRVAGPPTPGFDPLLVAQAGRDLASALHRTVGRLGLLVGADGAAAEPLRASRESAELALAAAELLADAALLLAGQRLAEAAPFEPGRALRDLFGEHGIPLVPVQTEEGTPRLWHGDPARFVALVRALLRAAATAGPVPPRLLLSAEKQGLVVTIGEGGEAPFEPVEATEASSGLGAAALMVRALGGRLFRARPAAGRAEQIRLHLPFAPAAEEDATRPTSGGLCVLAVDDVPANRQLLTTLLERHGHRCETAADADAALARLSAGGIDVVLMDVHMPGIDGVAAAQLIRSLPPPAGSVPIIAVTAQAAPGERGALLAAGMAEVIEKPVSSADLLAALARAVGQDGGQAHPQAPTIDRVAVAILRSTLGVPHFDRLVAEAVAVAEAALVEAHSALAAGDAARLEAALGRLCSAFEPFGAARLAEAAVGLRHADTDLGALRRVVRETLSALGWRQPASDTLGPLPART